jgi:hypothetical protein
MIGTGTDEAAAGRPRLILQAPVARLDAARLWVGSTADDRLALSTPALRYGNLPTHVRIARTRSPDR